MGHEPAVHPDAGRGRVWAVLLPVLAGVATFANTLEGGLAHDDPASIRYSRELGAEGWGTFFTVLRGLHHLLLYVDARLWGDGALGFHATTLVLYGAACALAPWMILRLGGSTRLALITGLLFAVHPVHVESVASVENRKEILAFLFVGGSVLAYVAENRRPWGLVAALALWALGVVWVKDIAVVGAIVLWPLVDGLRPGGPTLARAFLRAWPLAVLIAAGAFVLREQIAVCFDPDFIHHEATDRYFDGYGQVLAGIADSVPRNARLLFAPWHLVQDYTFPRGSFGHPRAILGVILLLSTASGFVLSLRRRPWIALGLGWIVVAYAPASNVLPLVPHFVADRFLFVASFGACLVVACLLTRLPFRGIASAGPLVVALLVTLGAGRSLDRNRDWKDSHTLNATALASGETTWRIAFRAGRFAAERQDWNAAAAHFRTAIEHRPGVGLFHFELGLACLQLGDFPAAVAAFERTVALSAEIERENKLPARYGFRREEGERRPGEPLRYLGIARAEAGDLDGAVAALRQAVRDQPRDVETLNDLAVALSRQTGFDSGLPAYGSVSLPNPLVSGRYDALARRLESEGRIAEAWIARIEAACFDPGNAAVLHALARFMVSSPRPDLHEPRVALAFAETAVARDPENVNYRGTLGLALLRSGELERAVVELERAVQGRGQLDPALQGLLEEARAARGE